MKKTEGLMGSGSDLELGANKIFTDFRYLDAKHATGAPFTRGINCVQVKLLFPDAHGLVSRSLMLGFGQYQPVRKAPIHRLTSRIACLMKSDC